MLQGIRHSRHSVQCGHLYARLCARLLFSPFEKQAAFEVGRVRELIKGRDALDIVSSTELGEVTCKCLRVAADV